MNRLNFQEAVENIAFTLKLASRGTPFVVECPEGNVLITPVANKPLELVNDELREQEKAAGYHNGPLPMPGKSSSSTRSSSICKGGNGSCFQRHFLT